jgi:methyl-accepting chemotaxis protein
MENSILLLILGVQTAVILAIALILFTSARKVTRLSEKLNELVDFYTPKADKIVEDTEEFIRSWEQAGNQVADIAVELRDIAETAKETTDDVAGVVQNTTFRAERQIDNIDHLVSDTVDRTQDAAEYLTRRVLPQFVELAAMIKGIYAAIDYLRGKRHFPFNE